MIENKKELSTVTYVKNNEEKTVTLHWWNKSFVLNEIFDDCGTYCYRIHRDISFVHFKNFTFGVTEFSIGFACDNVVAIYGRDDAVCILEQCQFTKRGGGSFKLKLIDGSFQMIQPDLRYVTVIDAFATDFDLVFLDELLGSSSFRGTVKCECDNVSIHDCGNISKLRLYSVKRAFLENQFNLETLFIGDNVKEVIVGSDKKATTITVGDSPKIYASKLVLNNCELNFKKEAVIRSEIEGENYTLKAPKIIINGNSYKAKNGSKVILTEKSLLEKCDGLEEKRLLISSLKARVKRLENVINERTNQYLQPGEEQIRKLEEQIATIRQQMQNLGDLQGRRRAQISRSLRRDPPKKYETR